MRHGNGFLTFAIVSMVTTAAVGASRDGGPTIAPAAPAAAAVRVAPMHVDASPPAYPRLIAFPNAAVRAKVNAALAAAEKTAREDRQGCIDLVRDAGRPARDAIWRLTVDVRYLTGRYLSLEIRNSYDCAGPYPTDDAPMPMTFDLTTGEPLDWRKVFKPNPAPDESGLELPSVLYRLYKQRYAKEGGRADPECKRVVQENLSMLVLRLDERRGLLVQPDFPHALAACADEIAFSPDQIAPYVSDAKFLADLRATVIK